LTTSLHDMKQRRDAITTRLLQIQAELAEMKRAWLADGKQGDHGRRATLEAEHAVLELEKHQLRLVLDQASKVEAQLHAATVHAVLIGLLKDRGHGALVIEARNMATERQALVTLTGAAHAA
jgi:hypothetical protein